MMSESPPDRSRVVRLAPGTARRASDLTRLGRAAVWYANYGWEVLPLYPVRGGLCTCPQATHCQSPGMHPIPHGQSTTEPTAQAAVVVSWWSQCPDAGVALSPGPASGFLVLDIDHQQGADDALARLPQLPRTVQAHDGIGRRFLYFAYPAAGGVRQGTTPLARGIKLRAQGVYVIAPPTLYAGGRLHRWEPELEPWRMPLAAAPKWLIDASFAKRLPDANPG